MQARPRKTLQPAGTVHPARKVAATPNGPGSHRAHAGAFPASRVGEMPLITRRLDPAVIGRAGAPFRWPCIAPEANPAQVVRAFDPPLNLATLCPSEPIRRPTCDHVNGLPSGPDGRFSTASDPQYSHWPRAVSSTARTSAPVIFTSGAPDIRRDLLARMAFLRHHAILTAGVVRSRKSSHDAYAGGPAAEPAASGSGTRGAGRVLASRAAASSGASPAANRRTSSRVGASR
jgi:hypothetical protein